MKASRTGVVLVAVVEPVCPVTLRVLWLARVTTLSSTVFSALLDALQVEQARDGGQQVAQQFAAARLRGDGDRHGARRICRRA